MSHSGAMVLLVPDDGEPMTLAWFSKRQTSVSLSSTESEIAAFVDAIRMSDEVIDVLYAMQFNFSVKYYIDNDPAKLAAVRGYSDKLTYLSKTRQIQIYWIPTYLEAVKGEVERVDTTVNPADMNTKILGRIRLTELCALSGIGKVTELEAQ